MRVTFSIDSPNQQSITYNAEPATIRDIVNIISKMGTSLEVCAERGKNGTEVMVIIGKEK